MILNIKSIALKLYNLIIIKYRLYFLNITINN